MAPFFSQVCRIAAVVRASGCDVPDWMLKLPNKTKCVDYSVGFTDAVARTSLNRVVKRPAITTDLKEQQTLYRLEKEKAAAKPDKTENST